MSIILRLTFELVICNDYEDNFNQDMSQDRLNTIKSIYNSKYKDKHKKQSVPNAHKKKEFEQIYGVVSPTETDILDELNSMAAYYEAHFHTKSFDNQHKEE